MLLLITTITHCIVGRAMTFKFVLVIVCHSAPPLFNDSY